MSEIVIAMANIEECETLYQEIKMACPGAYKIDIDSFDADSMIQIVIPLVSIIAGSTVLATLITKIFERNVINIDIDGNKYSGTIKNLPLVIEQLNKLLQKQKDTPSQ